MANFTYLDLAKHILNEEKRPLSVDELWDVAVAKGYDKQLRSVGKTPVHTLGAQIYMNIKDNSETSLFVKAGSRPTRFYLRSLLGKNELASAVQVIEKQIEQAKPPAKKFEYLEKELHPFLAYYAYSFLQVYTKTIQHTKSEKKEFGEWVHPDIVGCYFPVEDWKPEVVEFSSAIGNISIKLFSFEMKRELNFSNLREAFFQAVSNSSWAHEGYLVAAEISRDEEFTSELRRLSTSFGIGIINIDIDDPDSSEIMFPARARDNLDWDAINKLTMNPDFNEFLRRIKIDITSKEIRKEKYDKINEREYLIKMIKKESNQ